jgi:hypothetical protein
MNKTCARLQHPNILLMRNYTHGFSQGPVYGTYIIGRKKVSNLFGEKRGLFASDDSRS